MSSANYVKLRNLTEKDGEPAEAILQRGATQLERSGRESNR